MIIIGADYHPGFQQIAFVDTETWEEKREYVAPSDIADSYALLGDKARGDLSTDSLADDLSCRGFSYRS